MSSTFSPVRQDLRLSSLKLIRGGAIELSDGMKTIGDTNSSSSESCKLSRLQPSNDLQHCVLAVLHFADCDDEVLIDGNLDNTIVDIPTKLITCNVAGFVWVVQIDIERDVITVLAPCPGALPSKFLLVGSIKWVE